MVKVSNRLRLAVLQIKIEKGTRAYELARQVGMSPSKFSSLVGDVVPVHENDERVLAIARLVGVPDDEAFEQVPDKGGVRS